MSHFRSKVAWIKRLYHCDKNACSLGSRQGRIIGKRQYMMMMTKMCIIFYCIETFDKTTSKKNVFHTVTKMIPKRLYRFKNETHLYNKMLTVDNDCNRDKLKKSELSNISMGKRRYGIQVIIAFKIECKRGNPRQRPHIDRKLNYRTYAILFQLG